MDNNERLEFAKWILERQLAWIAAAEVKIGVLLAINTAMIGGVATVFYSVQDKSKLAVALAGLSVAMSVIALAVSVLAVWPQTKGPGQSFVFFGRISAYSASDYSRCFKAASKVTLFDDVLAQVHRNSQIAFNKYNFVSKAIKASAISAFFWVLAVVLLVNM